MGAIREGYAVVPDALTRALARSGATRSECLVALCLMRFRDAESGTMWRPAAGMAEELEMPVQGVRRACSGLVRRGVLERVASGHNGRAAVYRLSPGLEPSRRQGREAEPRNAEGGEAQAPRASDALERRRHDTGEYGALLGRVMRESGGGSVASSQHYGG